MAFYHFSVDEAAQAYADGEADGDRGGEDCGEAGAHRQSVRVTR